MGSSESSPKQETPPRSPKIIYVPAPKLLFDKPWRTDLLWNREYKEILKSEVQSFSPLKNVNISEARILLVGQIGAGKSSFFNTISSIFANRVTSEARIGSASTSLTTAFRTYQVRGEDDTPLKFRLCDTRGLEDKQGINFSDISMLLDGHIPDKYMFNPVAPISDKSPGFRKKPKLKDMIHCVVFVIDASTMEVMSGDVLASIQEMQKVMNQKDIPQVILLTKVDKMCTFVNEDLSKIFYSKNINDVVKKASETLGLPLSHVLVVKNYEHEMELNDLVDILALFSLRLILNFCNDFMKKYRNEYNTSCMLM